MNLSALQHSEFLHALGNALLNSLWQGFIIFIIYEIINISYKNASSAFKNKLSTFLIFVLFGWFLSSFITGFYTEMNAVDIAANPVSITDIESATESVLSIERILLYVTGTLPYLSVSYIFLLTFLTFRLLSSYRYVYFIANKRLVSPPQKLQHFASKVAEQLKITKQISVWVSKHIDVPATIGFLKPIILIPVASINNLSSIQLEAIILHELSHIKRNDYFTNLLISIIETILFFNPFIVLLSKIVKRERENCCDDFVLQYKYDPHSYASALLKLEQSRRSNLKLAIGAVSGKKQLLMRIKRITRCQVVSRQYNYGQKLLALVLVTSTICSIAWLSPQEKKKKLNKTFTTERIKVLDKFKAQGKVIPAEDINEGDKHKEVQLSKGITSYAQKSTIPLPQLLSDPENEFNLIDETPDLDNNHLRKQDGKEFSVLGGDTNFSPSSFDSRAFNDMPLNFTGNFFFKDVKVHIDIDDLNRSLKNVFKGIKTVNWKKFQNDINASLFKIKTDELSEREISNLYEEDLSRLLEKKDEQKERLNPKTLSALKDRKKLTSLDLLKQFKLLKTQSLLNTKESWRELTDVVPFQENGYNSFNYEVESAPLPQVALRELAKRTLPKTISISGLSNKTVKTVLENIESISKGTKNSVRYTISNSSDNKAQQRKVITIEINEAP
ncbi:MAG: M56 family metallopeptidase [Ginsengibacter sp.]